MKNITRILTIVSLCLFTSLSGLAQSADDSHKNFKKLFDDKEAKPSQAYNQKLCDAGAGFLAEYASDTKKARQTVNDLLAYGVKNLAANKALRADWYAKLSYAIVDKQHSTDEKGKAAFAALTAAVAEGETQDNANGQMINDWRGKIDTLAAMPNSQPYVLDREKGFYNFISRSRDPRMQKIVQSQLTDLSNSKDKDTANWAKQEIKMSELRKTAVPFAFAALDGKQFDASKLNNKTALYVYFWNATAKNASGEMEKLMDMYYEFSRKQVEFVAFCCDPEEKRAEVQTFVKKSKIKCPVYFDGAGTKGELYQKLCAPGMFSGYLFDNTGMLQLTNVKPGDLKKYIR